MSKQLRAQEVDLSLLKRKKADDDPPQKEFIYKRKVTSKRDHPITFITYDGEDDEKDDSFSL